MKIPSRLCRFSMVTERGSIIVSLALFALLTFGAGGQQVAVFNYARAQANDPQEDDNTVKNPKECLQTELVWAKDDSSTANDLVSDYFFSYPEGIRVTNRCDETVSTNLGVDAVLGGIVEDITSPGGGITNVETTSEEVLECEWFSTFLIGGDTTVLEFPEWVRDTAEQYHYERASHLASAPDRPDYWENLGWQHVRYKGCAEWSDERMKIGTGYRHTCPVGICPGETFTVTADYFFSGEVVQESGESGETEPEAGVVMTEPKCQYEYGIDAPCWHEFAEPNGCQYMHDRLLVEWFFPLEEKISTSWTGGCSSGIANGEGILLVIRKGELSQQLEHIGVFLHGKRHGQWITEGIQNQQAEHEGKIVPTKQWQSANLVNGIPHGLVESKREGYTLWENCSSLGYTGTTEDFVGLGHDKILYEDGEQVSFELLQQWSDSCR